MRDARKQAKPRPSPKAALTPKQVRFVAELAIDLNGKQAAIRAGYSQKSAEQQASALLRNPKVRAAVEKVKEAQLRSSGLSAMRVLEELRRIAFFDLAECFEADGRTIRPINEIPVAARAALASYKDGEIRRELKAPSLTTLARHFGLLKDVVVLEDVDQLVADLRAGRQRAREAALARKAAKETSK